MASYRRRPTEPSRRNSYAMAVTCKGLDAEGVSRDEIARRLKISTKTVGNYLRLLGDPGLVRQDRDDWREGKLTAVEALQRLSHDGVVKARPTLTKLRELLHVAEDLPASPWRDGAVAALRCALDEVSPDELVRAGTAAGRQKPRRAKAP